MIAKEGCTVRVHYTGKLKDGTVFDSSSGREPLSFTIGSGQVIKGFDDGVKGMKEGETKTIDIPAKDAYGEREESAVIEIPRNRLPQDQEPVKGMQLVMHGPNGEAYYPVISEVKSDTVILDMNHPLAGKDLIFDIEVVEVHEHDDACGCAEHR